MKEINNSPACERASDLIAFLYNETNASETRDFKLHLQACSNCREEVASFGVMRESITAWRDEVLAGFVSTPLATEARGKSAIAALRQFFDLSPLWLKGATAFAVITFCVLAILAIPKSSNNSASLNASAIYTQQDVDRIVSEALATQEIPRLPVEKPANIVIVKAKPKKSRVSEASKFAKSRRPLSRAEREQLAADLRLLSTDDNAGLQLLGDKINQ